tara:strand:- start:244 stop:435 length:192 start_codon:yes stop_codon:yes gene_type:complete
MTIFARLRERISFLKERFSINKVQSSKMAELSPETYQALIIFEAQVSEAIDLSLYRPRDKKAA